MTRRLESRLDDLEADEDDDGWWLRELKKAEEWNRTHRSNGDQEE